MPLRPTFSIINLYDGLTTLKTHIRSIHIIAHLMSALEEVDVHHFRDCDAVEVANLLMHLVDDMDEATSYLEKLIDEIRKNTKED